MPCIIRKKVGAKWENYIELAGDEWSIGPQIDSLDAWLRDNPNQLDPAFDWAGDIGFSARLGASGGGPVISKQLMERCLRANLEIYLSEYPPECADASS